MLPLEATNVLVCLRYGIGDTIMELPALSALRAALPDATITGIATPPAHELLDGDPRVDRVVLTSDWGLEGRWDRGDPGTRGRIAEWIEAQSFDLVLDARHAVDAVSAAIWSLGIRTLESRPERGQAAIRAGGSAVDAIRAAASAGWGLEIADDVQPALRLRPGDREFAREKLRQLTGSASGADSDVRPDTAPLAISPVASHRLKRWPIERLAAVADSAVERTGGPVIVLEGPQDEQGRRLVEAMDRADAARRVGAHHLLRTAALLERCRGLVSLDTGLMHMAVAVGTPTVGIFGPTRSSVFLPDGPGRWSAEPEGLECRFRERAALGPPDCWKAGHCLIGERSCVHRTSTGAVLAALDRLLEGKESTTRGMALAPRRAASDRRTAADFEPASRR